MTKEEVHPCNYCVNFGTKCSVCRWLYPNPPEYEDYSQLRVHKKESEE